MQGQISWMSNNCQNKQKDFVFANIEQHFMMIGHRYLSHFHNPSINKVNPLAHFSFSFCYFHERLISEGYNIIRQFIDIKRRINPCTFKFLYIMI